MTFFNQIVGTLSLAVIALGFVVGELASRLVVRPLLALRPRSRDGILAAWGQAGGRFVIHTVRWVGRAHIDTGKYRVPFRAGELIVMNHQSLIDIPIVYTTLESGYPRVVTRERYAHGIPLISFLIRFSDHILVRPGQMGAAELATLAEAGRTSHHPIVIFPEGHRTRDGEIRPWKRAGLETLLGAREWRVHVLVVDGLWQMGRLSDFIHHISSVRARLEPAGVFPYDGRNAASHAEFIDRLERAMCDKLASMRRAGAGEPASGAGAERVRVR